MSGRHGNHARGAKSGRYNHGKMVSSHGYAIVRVPRDHPRAFGACRDYGYAYEHDIIMEAHLGRHLEAGEVVHHKNENKQDNSIENLEIQQNHPHLQMHEEKMARKCQHARIVLHNRCARCGRFVKRPARQFPAECRVQEFPACIGKAVSE